MTESRPSPQPSPGVPGEGEETAPTAPAVPRRRWVVAQLGSREHYAAARAFHLRGRLRALYTDVWAPSGWRGRVLRRGPASIRALANRGHPELPSDKVIAFTGSAVLQAVLRFRRRGRRGADERCGEFIREGHWFCE